MTYLEEMGAPARPLGSYTVVCDSVTGNVVMRIGGVLPLPIGATIELDSHYSVPVVGVRLLRPASPVELASILCLDVEVPDDHWRMVADSSG